jgi:uncharacterized membrane protein YgcG
MNNLADVLEICLKDIEKGASLDGILSWYPDLEPELRLLLETSLRARAQRKFAVPDDIKRRGRARLLQYAAELRESKAVPRRRMIPVLSRAAVSLALVCILALTSTGFVNASSGALPGERLYPVKRTWEGVRLFFVLNPQEHDLLESRFEQERLNETDELLGKKLAAPITFTGLVTSQVDGHWTISGIPVSISSSTSSSVTGLANGAPVMVIGNTRSDGVVEAQQIQLLQPGGLLPPLEPSEKIESNGNGDQEDINPVSSPVQVTTPVPSASSQLNSSEGLKTYQFSGVVQSIKGNVWVINGQTVYTDKADITGQIKIGTSVKFEGSFDSDGTFVVSTVQEVSSEGSNSHRNDSGGSSSGNSGSGDHEGSGGGDGESGGGEGIDH